MDFAGQITYNTHYAKKPDNKHIVCGKSYIISRNTGLWSFCTTDFNFSFGERYIRGNTIIQKRKINYG